MTTTAASDSFETTPLLVDDRQVAKLLGCSRRLIQLMRSRRAGPPHIRLGIRRGQIRYPVDALRAWIAAAAADSR